MRIPAKLIAGFGVSAGARIVQLAFGFLSIVQIARSLQLSELGEYYIVSAFGIAASFIAFSFLSSGIQRLTPHDAEGARDFTKTLFVPSLIGCLAFLGVSVATQLAGSALPPWCRLACGALAYALGETIFSQFTYLVSTRSDHTGYFIAVCLRSILVLGGVWVMAATLPIQHREASTVILLYAGSALVSVVASSRYLRQSIRDGFFKPTYIKEALIFCWPVMTAQLFRQPLERGDRLLVGYLLGPAAAGQYSLASDLARRVIQGVTINARLVLGRRAVVAFDKGDSEETRASIRLVVASVLMIGIPLAGGISAFGPEFVAPLLKKSLHGSATMVLRVASLAYLIEAIRTCVLDLVLEITRRTRWQIAISISGLAVQVAGIFLLSHTYGIIGVSMAVAASQLASFVIAGVLARKALPGMVPLVMPLAIVAIGYLFFSGARLASGSSMIGNIAAGAVAGILAVVLAFLVVGGNRAQPPRAEEAVP